MMIKRNRREVTTSVTSVTCPVEYKGLTGCGEAFRYSFTNDAGLIECPNCGLWFAPPGVPAHAPTTAREALGSKGVADRPTPRNIAG